MMLAENWLVSWLPPTSRVREAGLSRTWSTAVSISAAAVVAGIASQGQDGSSGASGGGKPNSPAEVKSITKES